MDLCLARGNDYYYKYVFLILNVNFLGYTQVTPCSEVPPNNEPQYTNPQYASHIEGSSSNDHISKSVSASLAPVASPLTNNGNFLSLSQPLVYKEHPKPTSHKNLSLSRSSSKIHGGNVDAYSASQPHTASAASKGVTHSEALHRSSSGVLVHTGVSSSVKTALKLSNKPSTKGLKIPKKLSKTLKATKKQESMRTNKLESVTLKKVSVPTDEKQQKPALFSSHPSSKRSDSSLSLRHGSTLSSNRSRQTSGTVQSMSQLDITEQIIVVDDNPLSIYPSSTAQQQSDVPISTMSTGTLRQNFTATYAEPHDPSDVPPSVNLPTSQPIQVSVPSLCPQLTKPIQVSVPSLQESQDSAITDVYQHEDSTGKSAKLFISSK